VLDNALHLLSVSVTFSERSDRETDREREIKALSML